MKKLIFKCTVMVVIFIGISNYGLYLTTGKVPSFKSMLPDLSFNTPDVSELTPSFNKDTVYKWVDENGVTQYSSEPPPEQAKAEVMTLDPNTNVIQGLELKEEENTENANPKVAVPDGNIYSPENIKKIMDDTKNVQNLLDDRFKNQQKALDDL